MHHLSRLDPPECFLWAARARGRVYSLTGGVFRWLTFWQFVGRLPKMEKPGSRVWPKSDKVPPNGGVLLPSDQFRPVAGRARNAPRIVLDARRWCIRDDLGRFGSRFSRAGEFGTLDSCSPDVHQGEDVVRFLATRENRVFPVLAISRQNCQKVSHRNTLPVSE